VIVQVQAAVFSVAVGTMFIQHYLKPINGLPNPKGIPVRQPAVCSNGIS